MGTYRITVAADATTPAEPTAEGLKRLTVRLEDPEHALVYCLGFLGPADLLEEAATPEQQHRVCAWVAHGVVTADDSNPPSRKRLGTVPLPLEADPTKVLVDAKTLLSVLVTSVRKGVARGEVTLVDGAQRAGLAPFAWPVFPKVESLAGMARAEQRQLALESLEPFSSPSSKRPRI
jgi:hypothetical protein